MSDLVPGSKPADHKDDGISKYMKRMKTALKGGSRSNRNSVSSVSAIMGDSSKASATKAAAPSAR